LNETIRVPAHTIRFIETENRGAAVVDVLASELSGVIFAAAQNLSSSTRPALDPASLHAY
jgi:hypothetical protein